MGLVNKIKPQDDTERSVYILFGMMIVFLIAGGLIFTAFFGPPAFGIGFILFAALLYIMSWFDSPKAMGYFLLLLFLAMVAAVSWWVIG